MYGNVPFSDPVDRMCSLLFLEPFLHCFRFAQLSINCHIGSCWQEEHVIDYFLGICHEELDLCWVKSVIYWFIVSMYGKFFCGETESCASAEDSRSLGLEVTCGWQSDEVCIHSIVGQFGSSHRAPLGDQHDCCWNDSDAPLVRDIV